MEKPEMILFDYGRTLLYEPDFDPERGNRTYGFSLAALKNDRLSSNAKC